METTVNERIKRIIDAFEMNINSFSKLIGIAQTSLRDCVINGAEPKHSTLNKIIIAKPEISAEWLLTGKGEMINNQQIGNVSESTVVGANVNGNWNNIIHNNFKEMIELQKGYQDLLRKKDEHISELIGIINKIKN
jgi:hypothetical protein